MCSVSYVRHLDEIALKNSSEKTEDFAELEFIHERDDALDLVPVILEHSETPLVQMAGGRILSYIVSTKWELMEMKEKNELKEYICGLYENIPRTHRARMGIEKAMAAIAVHEFPENWSDFFEFVLNRDVPALSVIVDFLKQIKQTTDQFEHLTALRQGIEDHLHMCVDHIIRVFPDFESGDCLMELIPYMDGDMVRECALLDIYKENSESLKCLCELVVSPNMDMSVVKDVIARIARISDGTSWEYVRVVMKCLPILEEADMSDSLRIFHQLLLESDFLDSSSYWEFFVLSLYGSWKQRNTERLQVYEDLIVNLVIVTLNSFVCPEGCCFPTQGQNVVLFRRERRILLCLVQMLPELVIQILQQFLGEATDKECLMRFMWSLSVVVPCPAIRREDAMSLIEAAQQNVKEDNEIIGSFIWLAFQCLNKGRLSDNMIGYVTNLAYEGILDDVIQNVCLEFLVKVPADVLVRIVDPQALVLMPGSRVSSGQYRLLCEMAAVCDVSTCVEAVLSRWSSWKGSAITFESVRELNYILNGLIGISNAKLSVVSSVISEILSELQEIGATFVTMLMELIEEVGVHVRGREDASLMLGFMNTVMSLVIGASDMTSSWILEACALLPPEMFPSSLLSFCGFILSKADVEVSEYVLISFVRPLETLSLSSEERGVKVDKDEIVNCISILINTHMELVVVDDVDFLVRYLGTGLQSQSCILALTKLVIAGFPITEVAATIAFAAIYAACNDMTFLTELTELIYKTLEKAPGDVTESIIINLIQSEPHLAVTNFADLVINITKLNQDTFLSDLIALIARVRRATITEVNTQIHHYTLKLEL